MIKTIIFDLGNVIVNVGRTEQYRRFQSEGNKDIPCIKKYCHDNSVLMQSFQKGEIKPKEFYKRFSKGLNLKMNFNDFKRAYCDIFTLNKNVANLIKKLKKKYKLILLSNTDIMHFEYIKNKYKIIGIFDEYILSYEIGCRKPDRAIYQIALKKAKALPFNCVYIDDIEKFVKAARAIGIMAFQYKGFEKLIRDLKSVNVAIDNK